MTTPSRRALQLVAQQDRRAGVRARRDAILDAIVAGETYAAVASRIGVSDRTVRREVARALDGRGLDPPERHMRLQVERLAKTIRTLDQAIAAGDYGAVEPLLKVIDKLDRYHLMRPVSQRGSEAHDLLAARFQRRQTGAKNHSSP